MMIKFQNMKIILELIKHNQISSIYRGKNVGSQEIQSILENFHNDEYTIKPCDVPNILTGL